MNQTIIPFKRTAVSIIPFPGTKNNEKFSDKYLLSEKMADDICAYPVFATKYNIIIQKMFALVGRHGRAPQVLLC